MLFTKKELLNALNCDMVKAFNLEHNNSSNRVKAVSIMIEKVEKHLKDSLTYEIATSTKGTINKGYLFELTYNHYQKNYISEINAKGKKDNKNKKFNELKCLVDCSSTIVITPNELNENRNLLILLNDGLIYELTSKTIKENLNNLKLYKNGYRLYTNFIRENGKVHKCNY